MIPNPYTTARCLRAAFMSAIKSQCLDGEILHFDDINCEVDSLANNVAQDIAMQYLLKRKTVESAEAAYTGGGIYCYIGKMSDGTYFMAGDDVTEDYSELTIVDEMPDFDESWYQEWIDAHKIRDVQGSEAVELYAEILVRAWDAMNNGENMNATMQDMETRLHDIFFNL